MFGLLCHQWHVPCDAAEELCALHVDGIVQLSSHQCAPYISRPESLVVCDTAQLRIMQYLFLTSASTSVVHHGVQPTGCMDNELEPSSGVPC